jgi:hypothetical protein
MVPFVIMLLSAGCFVEVSSSTSSGTGSTDGDSLASRLEIEFARRAGGATAEIDCSAGLTGSQGHRLRCTGATSDGWTLEIAVLERGEGAFRWDVLDSHPIR